MPRNVFPGDDADSGIFNFSLEPECVSKKVTRSSRLFDNPAEAIPPVAQSPGNPMKASLDCGDLKKRSSDRAFTSFLDIKKKYHKEFLESVRQHVQDAGFASDVLRNNELVREACVLDFLGKYGMFYWGTEGSRAKYLNPAMLEKPAESAVYPEREEEIARAVMMLLEKKTKREWTFPGKDTHAHAQDHAHTLAHTDTLEAKVSEERPPQRLHTPPAPNPEPGITYTPGSNSHDTPGSSRRKKKKKKIRTPESSNSLLAQLAAAESPPSHGKSTQERNAAIHPLSEITSTLGSDSEFIYERKRKRAPASTDIDELLGLDDIEPAPQSPPRDPLTTPETKYQGETKFLANATTQAGMAPVWVPFQRFESATDFLDLMARECEVAVWSPDIQLSHEANDRATSPGVSVASVRFEWAEFAIRVRAGRDRDWEFVMGALQKAWAAKDAGEGLQQPGEFRIRVTLHVESV
ncbi:hypothetical protein PHISP_05464 [Aspergillus sp. HF37]|nr:hypothetical protein PHISP_05464 [Aspergillus sp. HF37]